jgi:hypothetical protein
VRKANNGFKSFYSKLAVMFDEMNSTLSLFNFPGAEQNQTSTGRSTVE